MKRIGLHRESLSNARRGVSLVELIITITLGGMVLMMGLGMMHLLLRTDKILAESLWRTQTVSRLSRTFRSDVHAARTVELSEPENAANANEPAPEMLMLELAEDHRVRYAIEPSAVLRTETQGEKTIQTERFRFSKETEISFEKTNGSLAAVVIRSPNPQLAKPNQPQHPVPLRELRIEAHAGRDHRFAGEIPMTNDQ